MEGTDDEAWPSSSRRRRRRSSTSRSTGDGPPLVLVHGLGLTGALWNRVCDALGTGTRSSASTFAAPARSRELERDGALARALGRPTSRAVLEALELERPALVGHSLGASDRAQARARAARAAGRARADRRRGRPRRTSAPRMLASAERIESDGHRAWVEEFWSKNPPFSDAVARSATRRCSTSTATCCSRTTPTTTSASAARSRPPSRCPAASARSASRRSSLVGGLDDRTLPEHGRELARALPNARLVELAGGGPLDPARGAARRRPTPIARVPREVVEAEAARRAARASCAPTRRRATRGRGRSATSTSAGSSAPQTGASLIAFGQSTYPYEATHENHHHPNAEEVVMVVSGRGTQIVGDRAPRPRPRRHLLHPAQHPAPDHRHLAGRGPRDPVGLRRRGEHRTGGLRPAPRRRGEGAVSDVQNRSTDSRGDRDLPRAGLPVPDPRAHRRAGRGGPRGARRPPRGPPPVAAVRADRPDRRLEPRRDDGDRRLRDGDGGRRGDRGEKQPHSVPFLFNLWERDERFWKIDVEPGDRRHGAAAARLGGGRPDGGRRRDQEARRRRQARLAPGLRVLAARDARRPSRAGSRSTTSAARTAAMRWPQGSHKLGEKLPVEFGDGSSFMHDERPGIGEVQDARGGRARGRRLRAQGRRVRLPRRADLARVGPEHEPEPAPRLHPALRRGRDDLARRAALPLQLHRRGARVRARRADPRPALPDASRPRSEGVAAAARHAPVTRRQ